MSFIAQYVQELAFCVYNRCQTSQTAISEDQLDEANVEDKQLPAMIHFPTFEYWCQLAEEEDDEPEEVDRSSEMDSMEMDSEMSNKSSSSSMSSSATGIKWMHCIVVSMAIGLMECRD
eukprot:TRINITY_DN3493_c2_g1_i4.p2 TRINITY_DN3493_c2_g1~~TRINITY_DN3493_c2_g1_i4.p2  ORF type:complete len:118 (+),score=34.86 TRINITY_DN3493_c2_g1_i4:555-908(+)